MPDGRLGLIDFGCCHRFSEDEFDYVMQVERAARSGDPEAIRNAMARGCDLDPAELVGERAELIRKYTDWTWAPITEPQPYDFGVPGDYAEGVKLYGEFIKRRWTRSQPVNVWLTKLFYGERAMLTHLRARVAYGTIHEEESQIESH